MTDFLFVSLLIVTGMVVAWLLRSQLAAQRERRLRNELRHAYELLEQADIDLTIAQMENSLRSIK